jgi:hypothetical protein
MIRKTKIIHAICINNDKNRGNGPSFYFNSGIAAYTTVIETTSYFSLFRTDFFGYISKFDLDSQ